MSVSTDVLYVFSWLQMINNQNATVLSSHATVLCYTSTQQTFEVDQALNTCFREE
jgi:hypothetical protein